MDTFSSARHLLGWASRPAHEKPAQPGKKKLSDHNFVSMNIKPWNRSTFYIIRNFHTEMSQPAWIQPTQKVERPVLKLFNSLTRTKVPFIPTNANEVTWYSCGPTVYDSSHMGHARNYVTIDINRRILQDFFGYNIKFVQNVTDIDDKIILKARQEYLFREFSKKYSDITDELKQFALESWKSYVAKHLTEFKGDSSNFEIWAQSLNIAEKAAENPKIPMHITAAKKALKTSSDLNEYLGNIKDVIVPELDKLYGSTVTDPEIFKQTSSYWEQRYDEDMERLNILPATVTTRVSEYVPEIVEFVQGIIDKGYAYATKDGSVYFDTTQFDTNEKHDYAKLQPWNKADLELLKEGEGSLSSNDGKRNSADFALWKSSKPGEPSWKSPWGQGRPGWHIECSVMASDITGESMDIHSGGIDLAFPHHDNELAQSEARFDCKQWVNYFLHTGHLHIEGQKMSKSLKNFITIDEALSKHSARQLRLCFALVQWNNQLDFKESLLNEVRSIEATFNNFFNNVRGLNNDYSSKLASGQIISKKFGPAEKNLINKLSEVQAKVYSSFCDNLSTPQVVRSLLDLIQESNNYISFIGTEIRVQPLLQTAFYITKILSVIGFQNRPDNLGWITEDQQDGQGANREDTVLPFVQALSSFRDFVRKSAISKDDYKVFLDATDKIRDVDLLNLGVVLDDRNGQNALIKFITETEKQELIKQQEEKEIQAQEKLQKKLQQIKLKEAKENERREKAKLSPLEMFKQGDYASLYTAWDDNGLPVKDAQGNEVTKSARKKLTKLQDQQRKLHEEFNGH
ncbi:BA75_04067T0 [Komagataella pastoris]|uniref:cysteine--tRNA ligase n=1 Tax=Komagataella pastoris TaxID=4922 RepID=A0A1B2JGH1_PICPA|nr:BA75_04067T0 [Komagataella pastoris]